MKISILIPYHDTPQTAHFLARLLQSIDEQTFKDYELVLMKEGRMGETYNKCIKRAKGEILKMMGMDDYFCDKDALGKIAANFDANPEMYWLGTACLHDVDGKVGHLHLPRFNDKLYMGYNTVGGFACVSLRNKYVPEIDESLDWTVDVDWYWRIYKQHGIPHSLDEPLVTIGIGAHQTTNQLTEEQKVKEWNETSQKYGN